LLYAFLIAYYNNATKCYILEMLRLEKSKELDNYNYGYNYS